MTQSESRARLVYVVSDLHIGGRYPAADAAPGDRGFRICTNVDVLTEFVQSVTRRATRTSEPAEIVINGDFVDFLAEELDTPERWSPFIADPVLAASTMARIIERDKPLFDALAAHLKSGNNLSILLGNHDTEMCLSSVREHLENALGVHGASGHLKFLYDGEAYVVGNAIIEHGNRYDGFNVIDHDGLRRLRSYQSRREPMKEKHDFRRAFGSRIVAEIMNAAKERFPFVDLLKPEDTAAIPILLALAPDIKAHLGQMAKLYLQARQHNPGKDSQPTFAGDISSTSTGGAGGDFGGGFGGDMGGWGAAAPAPKAAEDPALQSMLEESLGAAGAAELLGALPQSEADASGIDTSSDISAASLLGKVKLILSPTYAKLETRLSALAAALEGVRGDTSFDRDAECKSEYRDAAQHLLDQGFDWVVFGHTHMARQVTMNGGVYLNTGTWADLIKFPMHLLDLPQPERTERLKDFARDLDERRFDEWISFIPTFARLRVGANGQVSEGETIDYTGPASV